MKCNFPSYIWDQIGVLSYFYVARLCYILFIIGKEWVDKGWKDDGTGHGDYPNYAGFHYKSRNPLEDYFDTQERRHFGEPIHIDDELYTIWAPDDITNHVFTYRQMVAHCLGLFGILGGIILFSEFVYGAESRDPFVAKPYPYNNLYLELGGDPNKEPTEEDLKVHIPRGIYGW